MVVSGLAWLRKDREERTMTYGTTKSERTTLEDMVRIGEIEMKCASIGQYAGTVFWLQLFMNIVSRYLWVYRSIVSISCKRSCWP